MSPIGIDLKSFWENLVNGKSGIRPITQFDSASFDCRIAGEILGFNPSLYFKNPKDVRRADRFAQLAMASSKTGDWKTAVAWTCKRLIVPALGVLAGRGIRRLKESLEDQHTVLAEHYKPIPHLAVYGKPDDDR